MKKYGKRGIGMLLASMLLVLQMACGMTGDQNSVQPEEVEVVSLEAQVIAIKGAEVVEAEVVEAQVAEVQVSVGSYRESGSTDIEENDREKSAREQATEAQDRYVELPQQGNYYYDLENVVLYLYLYEELPDNYITKTEAKELGWEGGSVEKYKEGAAIGGDTFGNREGLLPEEDGRTYTECDLDTDGENSRGAKRLVFSNDGLYFYTEDHYETFDEVIVTEGYEVIW